MLRKPKAKVARWLMQDVLLTEAEARNALILKLQERINTHKQEVADLLKQQTELLARHMSETNSRLNAFAETPKSEPKPLVRRGNWREFAARASAAPETVTLGRKTK